MRPLPGSSGKLANLDLLRAVAVLSVLGDHIAATFKVGKQYGFFDLGQLGVLLFFVHTSLVLMQSLDRQKHASSGRGLTAFYIRRAFRIYPLSVLAVCVTWAFHIPSAPWTASHPLSLRAVLSSLLLVNNVTGTDPVIGPLWSLPLELQMYLTLPALYLLVRRASNRRLAWIWFASVAAGLAQAELAKQGYWGMWRLNLAQYAPCFLSGVVAYRLLETIRPRCRSFMWPAAIAGASTMFLGWQLAGTSVDRFPAYRGWLCCLLVGLALPFCRDCQKPTMNRITAFIAKYSYGIYLSQGIILWLAFIRFAAIPMPAQIAVFTTLMAAVPVCLFHLVEQPAIRLGALLAKSVQRGRKPRSKNPPDDLLALQSALGQAVSLDEPVAVNAR